MTMKTGMYCCAVLFGLCALALGQQDTVVLLQGDELSVGPGEGLFGTVVKSAEYKGGLDADLPGDESAYRLTKLIAGLIYYDCGTRLEIPITLPGDLTRLRIEVGYAKYQFGSSKGTLSWDGKELSSFSCANPTPVLAVATYDLTGGSLKAGKHTLTLADAGNGYVHIDAVRLTAAGAMTVGKPVPQIETPPPAAEVKVTYRDLPAHAVAGAKNVAWRGYDQFGPTVCSAYRSMWADMPGYKRADLDDPQFAADVALYQPQSFKIYGGVQVPQTLVGLQQATVTMRHLVDAARQRGCEVQMASGMYMVPCSGPRGNLQDNWRGAAWDPIADIVGPTPQGTGLSWLQVDDQGHRVCTPPDSSHPEWYGCPNNPNYYLYMRGYWIAQILGGGKGGYIDNPTILRGCCYCDFCKAAFRKFMTDRFSADELQRVFGVARGEDLQPPTQAGSPLWTQWTLFRRDSMSSFMKRLCDDLHQRDPQFALSCNMGAEPGPGYPANANDLSAMGAACDYLYLEIGAGPHKVHVRYSTTPVYQFMSACAQGKRAIPLAIFRLFPAGASGSLEGDTRTLRARTLLQLAEAAACGLSYEPHLSMCRSQPAYGQAVADWMRFARESAAAYQGQSLFADVGVVCSTSGYYAGVSPWFMTTFRLLADAGVPAVALLPEQLTESDLGSRYRCLVLPPTPMLSDLQVDGLARYVSSGGSLILVGKSGSHDPRGLAREKNAVAEFYQAMQVDLKQPPADVPVATFGRGKLAFIAAPPAEETAYDYESGILNAWEGQSVLGLPAVVERLRQAPPLLKVTAGQLVETTLMHRQSPGALLVNVLNYDVTYQTAPKPATGITIELAVPERKVSKVTVLSPTFPPRPLKYRLEGVTLKATLPEVFTYAAILVE